MKALFFGLAGFICTSVGAQWRFSLTYYQATTYFNGAQSHEYDATDLFAGWDDFVRFNVAYQFSEEHALDGWLDLNDSFKPSNFKLGYQYWFSDYFYSEVVAMNLALFSIRFDEDVLNSGNGRYFHMRCFGVGMGARKSLGILELSSSFHFLKGLSVQDRLVDLFISDSNFRYLRTQDFNMSNVWSTNMEIGAAVNLFQGDNLSGGLMYKLVWRRDRFDYTNEVHAYEWTKDNEVSAEVYQSGHAFDHLQHQIGFIIMKK